MLQENKESVSKKIEKYKKDVEELSRYLGWLESKKGEDLRSKYDLHMEAERYISVEAPAADEKYLRR